MLQFVPGQKLSLPDQTLRAELATSFQPNATATLLKNLQIASSARPQRASQKQLLLTRLFCKPNSQNLLSILSLESAIVILHYFLFFGRIIWLDDRHITRPSKCVIGLIAVVYVVSRRTAKLHPKEFISLGNLSLPIVFF